MRPLFVLVWGLFAAPAAAQLFVDVQYELPSTARDVAGGDLDGDGDLDLVTCSSLTGADTSSAQVWINNGNGGFTAGASPLVLDGITAVSVADVDDDGRLDMVLSSPGESPLNHGGVMVQLGDGAGGFSSFTSQFVLGGPTAHAMADVNADGRLDVALAAPGVAAVALLLGAGDGGFGSPTFLTAGSAPVDVALPDLQLDGEVDLVALSNVSGKVSVRLGGPGSSFGPASSTQAGSKPLALLAAAFDGDAFPDVLVACDGDDTLSLLRGDGRGGLLPPLSFPALPQPCALAAGDVDLDGDLDAVVAHDFTSAVPMGHAVSFMLNDGAGGLAAPQGFLAGAFALGVAVGDVDGDLLPDVAAARYTDALAVRRGNGLGGLVDLTFVPAGSSPLGATLADLDGDLVPDLALTNASPATVSVLLVDQFGELGPVTTFPVAASSQPSDLAAADITGDGIADLVSANVQVASVSLLVGDGSGGFAPHVDTACGKEPRRVGAADLDGDGDADVVTCNTTDSTVAVLRAVGGALQPAVPTAVGPHPTAMALGHVDAGGTVDVVTSDLFSVSYSLLRGDGAGGWLPKLTVSGDNTPVRALALGDVDGDGDDDVISAFELSGGSSGHLAVRKSDGNGGLLPPNFFDVPLNPADLVLADLDLDGALDVAIAHDGQEFFFGAELSVSLGDGEGGYGEAEDHLLQHTVTTLAAGDLDQDGLVDLVAAVADGEATVLRNVSGGASAWTVLGFALPGQFAPKLAGAGTLVTGSPGSLTLFDAPPLAPGALFFAPTSAPAAFKGGVLVPVPPAVTALLVVPANGVVKLPWLAFPAVSSGSTFYFQAAVADAGAPAKVALSNALLAVAP